MVAKLLILLVRVYQPQHATIAEFPQSVYDWVFGCFVLMLIAPHAGVLVF